MTMAQSAQETEDWAMGAPGTESITRKGASRDEGQPTITLGISTGVAEEAHPKVEIIPNDAEHAAAQELERPAELQYTAVHA